MTILDIRSRLLNDEIDFSVAFEQIKKFPMPWHTKNWVDKRNNIIKSECEQCNHSNEILVAQHLTHPIEFKTIRNEICVALFDNFLKSTVLPKPNITNNDIKQFHDKTSKVRDACPECNWIRIRKRKTMKPEYFCEICKIDFDTPTKIDYNEIFKTVFPNEEQVINYLIDIKSKEILWDLKNKLYAENEKAINKKALLISIDLHLKYIELENVVTFCKKCAANMDLNHKLLCWTCKTDYFSYELYDCCYKCYERKQIVVNPFKNLIWRFRDEDNNYNKQTYFQE